MKTLITICARAGSKGLPGKAMLEFNGKPLSEWTIEQAIEWGWGDILVSTDSTELVELAHRHNLSFVSRTAFLCQDDTPKLDVIRDALLAGERINGVIYDCIIDLDVTNPCRTVQDIENCFQIFRKKQPKTLFSVTKSRKNPFFNMVAEFGFAQGVYTRRQDAPKVYDLNSCIYIYDREWLLNPKNLSPITDNSEIYVMPGWAKHDIDDEQGFFDAENNFKKHLG